MTLLTNGSPSNFGKSVTLIANVTPVPQLSTGFVTFYDGTTLLGSIPLGSAGQATLNTIALRAGRLSLSAYYSGGMAGGITYSSATSPAITQMVNTGAGTGFTAPRAVRLPLVSIPLSW